MFLLFSFTAQGLCEPVPQAKNRLSLSGYRLFDKNAPGVNFRQHFWKFFLPPPLSLFKIFLHLSCCQLITGHNTCDLLLSKGSWMLCYTNDNSLTLSITVLLHIYLDTGSRIPYKKNTHDLAKFWKHAGQSKQIIQQIFC